MLVLFRAVEAPIPDDLSTPGQDKAIAKAQWVEKLITLVVKGSNN